MFLKSFHSASFIAPRFLIMTYLYNIGNTGWSQAGFVSIMFAPIVVSQSVLQHPEARKIGIYVHFLISMYFTPSDVCWGKPSTYLLPQRDTWTCVYTFSEKWKFIFSALRQFMGYLRSVYVRLMWFFEYTLYGSYNIGLQSCTHWKIPYAMSFFYYHIKDVTCTFQNECYYIHVWPFMILARWLMVCWYFCIFQVFMYSIDNTTWTLWPWPAHLGTVIAVDRHDPQLLCHAHTHGVSYGTLGKTHTINIFSFPHWLKFYSWWLKVKIDKLWLILKGINLFTSQGNKAVQKQGRKQVYCEGIQWSEDEIIKIVIIPR